MIIAGLQKLTLIDYPGKIAATVFTLGCNFACPFCHNPKLVKFDRGGFSENENYPHIYDEQAFFDFLKSRQKKLDGVCITGGEPTLQKDLPEFIKKIKDLGFLVKLDTNGSNPEVLEKLLEKSLVDFFAMDIKNNLKNYIKATAVETNLENIKKSAKIIKESKIFYEFRTTVVPGIHKQEDIEELAQELAPAKKYVLQKYRDKIILDETLRERSQKKSLDLKIIQKKIEKYFDEVDIR